MEKLAGVVVKLAGVVVKLAGVVEELQFLFIFYAKKIKITTTHKAPRYSYIVQCFN